MKTIKHILVLIFFIAPLVSCDELEELLEEEIEVQTSFTTILTIESPMTSNPEEAVNFQSNIGSYNFNTDPNVTEIIADPSEITKIEITRIRYLFQDVEGNPNAVVAGAFEISMGMATEEFETVQTNLAQADASNTLFFINGNFSNVNEALTEFHAIAFFYRGSVSDNPVDFKVDVTIDVTVTIKPDLDL